MSYGTLTAVNPCTEGTPAPRAAHGSSLSRCGDTQNNQADFLVESMTTPGATNVCAPPPDLAINPDLATPPDLAGTRDLAVTPDLAVLPTPDLASADPCVAAGATPSTSFCCAAVQDYANLCGIGPCGCAPMYSHTVKTCQCPANKCWNGTACQ